MFLQTILFLIAVAQRSAVRVNVTAVQCSEESAQVFSLGASKCRRRPARSHYYLRPSNGPKEHVGLARAARLFAREEGRTWRLLYQPQRTERQTNDGEL
ncbi:hypothetical protein EVAR_66067_1 [Eumeta japonica]|uniref:Secreted protein n=1 Tax=Eumeta variegata TaxID=151549 RepID=A0A4C2A1P3_EUMVA|nr:hypothetical protein EVAR_66067_1 [Eumeta japonica]